MLENGLYWQGIIVSSEVVGPGTQRQYFVKFPTLSAAHNIRAQVQSMEFKLFSCLACGVTLLI